MSVQSRRTSQNVPEISGWRQWERFSRGAMQLLAETSRAVLDTSARRVIWDLLCPHQIAHLGYKQGHEGHSGTECYEDTTQSF